MYHIGCGTINCGHRAGLYGSYPRLLGLGASSSRFTVEANLDNAQRNNSSIQRPDFYFYVAWDMIDALYDYVMATPVPAFAVPYDSTSAGAVPAYQVNPDAVNLYIDIVTNLNEIAVELQKGKPYVDTWPAGSHYFTFLQDMQDKAFKCAEIAARIGEGIKNAQAAGLAAAQQRAQEAGADIANTRDYLVNRFAALWGNAEQEVKDSGQAAINEFSDAMNTYIVKPLGSLDWLDMAKIVVPVGAVALIAYFALK